jgi:hypothetical protein
MDKRKGANNDLQKVTQKTKDRATRTPLKLGLHGRDRMVVGFTTIYAISSDHH